ncbi:hypothetical protein HRI_001457600 [Hibiscus trionum]|uniref:(S)-2-hydroxy-acid oxidase n=1 Tax=Hibiscus trionum TaxID=183268 RepID=A0A9W7LVB0_HIBTR|nr:hypothetical protein HRI_001457600 [Hibiscus trionum]
MAGEPIKVNEFRELARQALPKMYYDFYAGGAEDQYTLKENEEAFSRIIIQPRILRDVTSIDLSTTVLGYNISMPVMIAPTSMHKLANPAAIKSMEVGVAGIIVSNHGGRQLDYSPATIDVLEEVVHAVGGKVPVFIDGGIRRGTDIFKAMALGARAILVGRPVVFGLAAKGEHGVKRVLEMLKDELELTMALSGCSSITRSHVRTKHEQRIISML